MFADILDILACEMLEKETAAQKQNEKYQDHKAEDHDLRGIKNLNAQLCGLIRQREPRLLSKMSLPLM